MSKSDAAKRFAGKNKAVALRYRVDEDAAPVVIASGYGTIAEKIIGIAEEKGIPVYKDDSTASMLCMLEVGRDIPPDLYQVIAAIYENPWGLLKKGNFHSIVSCGLGTGGPPIRLMSHSEFVVVDVNFIQN